MPRENKVSINYQVGELEYLDFGSEQFDAIELIYAHFPAEIKSIYHKKLDKYLHKGGIIIFEAVTKKHLDYMSKNENIGGSKDIASIFSIEEIKLDFPNYNFLVLEEAEIELNEGLYHNKKVSVIRFVGTKK